MKPTRRSIIIPLIIVLFVLLISCHQVSKHAYKYPKEYSAEYCYYEYELFDPNIVYTECYEFVSKKDWGWNPKINFSAVKDCDDLSFMVYYKKGWLVGAVTTVCVVRRCDCDINPSADYTPASAELFWYDGNKAGITADGRIDEEYYFKPQYLSQTAVAVDKKEAVDEIMDIAVKESFLSHDEFMQEQNAAVSDRGLSGIYSEKGELYVKVSFEECDGLVFIGRIMVDDSNNSFLQHLVYYCNEYEDPANASKLQLSDLSHVCSSPLYYRLGECMDALVQQVIS